MIKDFIPLIITGIIISYFLRPIHNAIKKVLRNDSASAIISELLFFSSIIMLAIFLINSLYYQLSNFSSPIISQFINIQEFIENSEYAGALIDFNDDLTTQIFAVFSEKAMDLLLKTPTIILDIFLLLFIVYYLTAHNNEIYKIFISKMPSESKASISRFFSKISELIKELSFGYFLVSVFVMLLSFLFFNFINLTLSLDYAILSGLFSLIPLVGNWAVPTLLSAYFFYSKKYFSMALMIAFSAFLSYILKMVRKVTNKNKTIHPVLLILGVIIGFYSFGLLGFIIGPAIFGILQLGFQEILSRQKNI